MKKRSKSSFEEECNSKKVKLNDDEMPKLESCTNVNFDFNKWSLFTRELYHHIAPKLQKDEYVVVIQGPLLGKMIQIIEPVFKVRYCTHKKASQHHVSPYDIRDYSNEEKAIPLVDRNFSPQIVAKLQSLNDHHKCLSIIHAPGKKNHRLPCDVLAISYRARVVKRFSPDDQDFVDASEKSKKKEVVVLNTMLERMDSITLKMKSKFINRCKRIKTEGKAQAIIPQFFAKEETLVVKKDSNPYGVFQWEYENGHVRTVFEPNTSREIEKAYTTGLPIYN